MLTYVLSAATLYAALNTGISLHVARTRSPEAVQLDQKVACNDFQQYLKSHCIFYRSAPF